MDSHTELCFPTFLSDRSGFKVSSNRSNNLDLNSTNVTGTALVSKTPSNDREKSSSSTKDAQFIDPSKSGKSCVSQTRKLTTPNMDNFQEKLPSEGLSKESISLLTNTRKKDTTLIKGSPSITGIAGVVGERFIPLDVL